MFAWIINFIKRLFLGETDINRNGIPDNKEILKLIQSKIDKELEKKNKKILKKILK
tara:strand:- start:26 stop:193 length:168 start_codon:yes stop_codon:yes gene_type:complete